MKFVNIGYDIRFIEHDAWSADLNLWAHDEVFYDLIKSKFEINENSSQLLSLSHDMMMNVSDFLTTTNTHCIVSIQIPSEMFDYFRDAYGLSYLDNVNSDNYGFDVCDLNGLFSYFDMQDSVDKLQFNKMNMQEKLMIPQMANLIIPSHKPFSLVKISKLP